jgi:hypothetical protein
MSTELNTRALSKKDKALAKQISALIRKVAARYDLSSEQGLADAEEKFDKALVDYLEKSKLADVLQHVILLQAWFAFEEFVKANSGVKTLATPPKNGSAKAKTPAPATPPAAAVDEDFLDDVAGDVLDGETPPKDGDTQDLTELVKVDNSGEDLNFADQAK